MKACNRGPVTASENTGKSAGTVVSSARSGSRERGSAAGSPQFVWGGSLRSCATIARRCSRAGKLWVCWPKRVLVCAARSRQRNASCPPGMNAKTATITAKSSFSPKECPPRTAAQCPVSCRRLVASGVTFGVFSCARATWRVIVRPPLRVNHDDFGFVMRVT